MTTLHTALLLWDDEFYGGNLSVNPAPRNTAHLLSCVEVDLQRSDYAPASDSALVDHLVTSLLDSARELAQ